LSPLKRSTNIAARMGRWSASHWKTATFGWLAFVIAAVILGGNFGTTFLDPTDTNVGEAKKADQLIESGFPSNKDEQGEIVLIKSSKLKADDAAFVAVIKDVTKTVDSFPQVAKIQSPLEAAHKDQVSDDGHAVMVTFQPKGTFDEAALYIDKIDAAVEKAHQRHPGFFVDEMGSVSTEKAIDSAFGSMLAKAGLISIPLTLVILLLVFGSLTAALIPLLLALSAVMATIGLVAFPSSIVPMDEQVNEVILLIGLAVGVDYSLFYVKREREERRAGRSEGAALEAAAATSGRAVLISGITVMTAMAGMFLSGDKTFMSFSVATMIVVLVAMIGSLTVLPALLGRLGDKIEKGRVPFIHRFRSKNGEGRFWGALLDRVLKRPVLAFAAAAAILVALMIPAFQLTTAQTTADDISIAAIEPARELEHSFAGSNDPAVVAVKADDVRAPAVQDAINELKSKALADKQMGGPVDIEASRDNTVAKIEIPLEGKGTDDVSKSALDKLRNDYVPQTVGQVDGVEYAVGGQTAADKDWSDKMTTTAPLIFGFVLLFSFLLMLVSFRSVAIAIKSIVLNLLSVGAAYGVLVATFQWGWGEGLFDFHSNGGITPWLPMFLFVILFGLSMDYHVFILSRIKEGRDRGLSTDESIHHGIKKTAGVVTSASLVMVLVFLVFSTLPLIDMKEMGIGLAAAVLIDATIIRGVLLPATMKLLGEWNWYLPRWLNWLPELKHETETGPEPVAIPARAR
jgi:RND superfamily putative drug exporter